MVAKLFKVNRSIYTNSIYMYVDDNYLIKPVLRNVQFLESERFVRLN